MDDLNGIEKRTNSRNPRGHIIFSISEQLLAKPTPSKINICNKLSQHPCKEINTGLKKLYKDKLIRYKKTNHGDDVYLNIHEKSKIEEEIKDKLEQLYTGNKHIS